MKSMTTTTKPVTTADALKHAARVLRFARAAVSYLHIALDFSHSVWLNFNASAPDFAKLKQDYRPS